MVSDEITSLVMYATTYRRFLKIRPDTECLLPELAWQV